MKKILVVAALAAFTAGGAWAQVDKAASEANDAVQHKVEEKRADDAAAKSGPVGKVVNKTKAGYHKAQAKHSTKKAKQSMKKAVE